MYHWLVTLDFGWCRVNVANQFSGFQRWDHAMKRPQQSPTVRCKARRTAVRCGPWKRRARSCSTASACATQLWRSNGTRLPLHTGTSRVSKRKSKYWSVKVLKANERWQPARRTSVYWLPLMARRYDHSTWTATPLTMRIYIGPSAIGGIRTVAVQEKIQQRNGYWKDSDSMQWEDLGEGSWGIQQATQNAANGVHTRNRMCPHCDFKAMMVSCSLVPLPKCIAAESGLRHRYACVAVM